MKKIFFFLFFSTLYLSVNAQYAHNNIDLVGHWYNPAQVAEPVYGIKYNSVWGWMNPKNNVEYAILGSGSGTYIIDLSAPSNPKEAAFVPGKRNKCIWREYKTYKNYLYAISDDASPNSFQIIDLSYLPDSVHVVYDGSSLFERAHTLLIDGQELYCGSVKQSTGGQVYSMAVYSLANPEKPVFLRALDSDAPSITAVHDMLVRNDTVYASCGNDGLFIYLYDKVANKFIGINSIEFYPGKGYNHSSALTPDGRTLVFCDEVPRDLPVKIANISDLHNISIDTVFRSANGPTPHNPYMKGKNHVVIAYYQDGLQIFDIRNHKFPVKTGYFDTDTIDGPDNDYNPTGTPYHGNWGAYVDLPSQLLLASDMQNGLYVLNAEKALGIDTRTSDGLSDVLIYPNPSNNVVSVQFNLPKATVLTFEVLDMAGRKLFTTTDHKPSGLITARIPLESVESGMYLIRISGEGVSHSSKFIKE
jgi:choice-of-anchor B domain-containing protein